MSDIPSVISAIGSTLPESLGSVGHVARPESAPLGLVVCIGDLHAHVGLAVEAKALHRGIGHGRFPYMIERLAQQLPARAGSDQAGVSGI